MVYCVHAALFWKSMVVLEEFVVEFVQHPLDTSEIFDKAETLLLDCIENISLSESCLNEGWADRPRGRVHMSNKSNPVFQECCFFTGRFFAIQDNILLFSGKKRKSIL